MERDGDKAKQVCTVPLTLPLRLTSSQRVKYLSVDEILKAWMSALELMTINFLSAAARAQAVSNGSFFGMRMMNRLCVWIDKM